ncbi:hypothetical protein BU9_CDS0059 [Klebsiella phage Kpn BU9]|nr:hypothetical protein BU9_CDS0059 [Klebsiella phage Kpn BU9]
MTDLEKRIKELRRRQVCVRESIEILRKQWRDDQEELAKLAPQAVRSGFSIDLELSEP